MVLHPHPECLSEVKDSVVTAPDVLHRDAVLGGPDGMNSAPTTGNSIATVACIHVEDRIPLH